MSWGSRYIINFTVLILCGVAIMPLWTFLSVRCTWIEVICGIASTIYASHSFAPPTRTLNRSIRIWRGWQAGGIHGNVEILYEFFNGRINGEHIIRPIFFDGDTCKRMGQTPYIAWERNFSLFLTKSLGSRCFLSRSRQLFRVRHAELNITYQESWRLI